MNLKYFFAGLALAVPVMMSAVPADPRVRTLTNPDGSTVEVRVHGDEFFHFMTDAECTRIIERDANGFLVDAVRFGNALKFNPDDVAVLRAEVEEVQMANMGAAYRNGMQKMATLNSEGRSNYPTIGEGNRSLVVLVEFSDVDFYVENPKEYFTRQLNEPGFSDYGAVGSAIDYYRAISNGKYLPQFDVVGPVKIDYPASYFKDNNSGNMKTLIYDAITKLHDAGEIDFSNYDLDGDGIVDTVFFYYAGYGSADSETETIWPHQYDYRYFNNAKTLILDGKMMGPYACANELKGVNPETRKQPWKDGSEPWVGGIGTFVHEYGHVLGLPDLYDVEYSGKAVTPGEWDVMDMGSYNFDGCCPPLFSAYEQWVCRWLEYETVADGTHYDLASLGHTDSPSAVRIRIPMSSNGTTFQSEYFVIESRDNTGWDSCFHEPGLMVWRINYKKSLWLGNSVNSQYGSNVEIVYAKSDKFPLFSEGAIYPGAKVELVPSKDYSLWKSPVITGISYDADKKVGSFDYNMVTPPDVATLLHDSPKAYADGSRSFTLEWDPVEGVTEYLVTVRTVKNGKIIGGFDATSVGTSTKVAVERLSSVYWKLDMEAYVTCVVDGMVSAKNSNIITFKPSELPKAEEENAVGSVGEDDVKVYGGKGCVIAPEGAEVFNTAGRRLRNGNLAPGVYIVVYNSKSVKVLVR